jgi:hypothetical protein
LIALAFVVLGLIGQAEPAAAVAGVQTFERQGSSYLKDPRKAGIEQIHFKKLTHTQKNTHTTWNYKIPRRNCRFAASSGLAGAAMAAAPERRA